MKLSITVIFLASISYGYSSSDVRVFPSFQQTHISLHRQDTTCSSSLTGQRIASEVDKPAVFPIEGTKGLRKYLEDNRRYPPEQVDWQGAIYVTFIVDASGKISKECLINRRFKGDVTPIEKEALKLVATMPDWIPAKYKGKKVAMQVTVPVRF